MGENSRHPGGTPGLHTDTYEQQGKRSKSLLSYQLLASSSKQQRGCCLFGSWPRKRKENVLIFSPAETHELPWVNRSRKGTLRTDRAKSSRDRHRAPHCPGSRQMRRPSPLTSLGTQKGSGCARWDTFPEHCMRGMQVGGAVSSGIHSRRGLFQMKNNETGLAGRLTGCLTRRPGLRLPHNPRWERWCTPVIPASPW